MKNPWINYKFEKSVIHHTDENLLNEIKFLHKYNKSCEFQRWDIMSAI